jgi:LPS sulfotransferase NodH
MEIPPTRVQVGTAEASLASSERRAGQAFPPSFHLQPSLANSHAAQHPAPGICYAICTNPRSGSWLLSEGLAFTSLAGYPLEWLNIAEEQKRSALWRLKFSDDSALPEYLSLALKTGRTGNGIFGIKLQYYQFAELPKRMAATEKFRGLPTRQLMSVLLPNLKYLWLTRRDKARQAVSFYRAYKTGAWWLIDGLAPGESPQGDAHVDFDPEVVMGLEEVFHGNDIGWESYFRASGITPLTLYYEDFVADYAEGIRTVLKWLNIPDAETVPIRDPRLKRQSDTKTEEWLIEYLRFKKTHGGRALAPSAKPAFEVSSPLYELTRDLREHAGIPPRPHKMLSLLNAFRKLESLRVGAGVVERRAKLTRDEFLERHYASNRPVIIQGIMDDWPAMSLWTPQYLKDKAGSDQVDVEAGCDTDANYASNPRKHKKTVRFSECVAWAYSGVATNGCRIEADKSFFGHSGTRLLLNDFTPFSEYLDVPGGGRPRFWFGPAGTVAPLRHCICNSLLAQVVGRRHLKAIPANQWQYVYNEFGTLSQVDCENPDFERWPLFRSATVTDFDLEPGEVLFMPVGWWFHARNVDVNIAVSFTNFVFPNYYDWPEELRDFRALRNAPWSHADGRQGREEGIEP